MLFSCPYLSPSMLLPRIQKPTNIIMLKSKNIAMSFQALSKVLNRTPNEGNSLFSSSNVSNNKIKSVITNR